MRTSLMATAGLAAATALVGVSLAGCHSKSEPSTATSGSAASTTSHGSAPTSAPTGPTDYAKLLIRAEDIDAPVTFTAAPPTPNPDGREGVTTTFSEKDGGHVIVDTILILPDPAAATAALDAAKGTLPGSVIAGPTPVDVGTGGTTVSGKSPDESKGVTMLRFTQGRAFVTLEFDGPAKVSAPDDFVTGVGQKQAAAIKDGLPA